MKISMLDVPINARETVTEEKKVYNLEKLLATPTTSERLASRGITRCSDDMSLSTLSSTKRLVTTKEPPQKDFVLSWRHEHYTKRVKPYIPRNTPLLQDLTMIAGSKVVESSAKEKMHYTITINWTVSSSTKNYVLLARLKVRKLLKIFNNMLL